MPSFKFEDIARLMDILDSTGGSDDKKEHEVLESKFEMEEHSFVTDEGVFQSRKPERISQSTKGAKKEEVLESKFQMTKHSYSTDELLFKSYNVNTGGFDGKFFIDKNPLTGKYRVVIMPSGVNENIKDRDDQASMLATQNLPSFLSEHFQNYTQIKAAIIFSYHALLYFQIFQMANIVMDSLVPERGGQGVQYTKEGREKIILPDILEAMDIPKFYDENLDIIPVQLKKTFLLVDPKKFLEKAQKCISDLNLSFLKKNLPDAEKKISERPKNEVLICSGPGILGSVLAACIHNFLKDQTGVIKNIVGDYDLTSLLVEPWAYKKVVDCYFEDEHRFTSLLCREKWNYPRGYKVFIKVDGNGINNIFLDPSKKDSKDFLGDTCSPSDIIKGGFSSPFYSEDVIDAVFDVEKILGNKLPPQKVKVNMKKMLDITRLIMTAYEPEELYPNNNNIQELTRASDCQGPRNQFNARSIIDKENSKLSFIFFGLKDFPDDYEHLFIVWANAILNAKNGIMSKQMVSGFSYFRNTTIKAYTVLMEEAVKKVLKEEHGIDMEVSFADVVPTFLQDNEKEYYATSAKIGEKFNPEEMVNNFVGSHKETLEAYAFELLEAVRNIQMNLFLTGSSLGGIITQYLLAWLMQLGVPVGEDDELVGANTIDYHAAIKKDEADVAEGSVIKDRREDPWIQHILKHLKVIPARLCDGVGAGPAVEKLLGIDIYKGILPLMHYGMVPFPGVFGRSGIQIIVPDMIGYTGKEKGKEKEQNDIIRVAMHKAIADAVPDKGKAMKILGWLTDKATGYEKEEDPYDLHKSTTYLKLHVTRAFLKFAEFYNKFADQYPDLFHNDIMTRPDLVYSKFGEDSDAFEIIPNLNTEDMAFACKELAPHILEQGPYCCGEVSA